MAHKKKNEQHRHRDKVKRRSERNTKKCLHENKRRKRENPSLDKIAMNNTAWSGLERVKQKAVVIHLRCM